MPARRTVILPWPSISATVAALAISGGAADSARDIFICTVSGALDPDGSAGRVCALPVEIGGTVGAGEDIAFVEAMKMEIPVASPAAGKLKSILVSLDDMVAEGQVLAILET